MTNGSNSIGGVHPRRLFRASCVALVATSCSFAVFSDIMPALKASFLLSNEEVGWIRGAQMWGFPLTILIFGPLCDALGMRLVFRLAFLMHLAGVALMWQARGFWMLFAGALVIGMGNGLVEAAGNPLVATVFPDQKTKKLNQFHVWFPGGIVIGSVLGYTLTQSGVGTWQWKLLFILIPTLTYGWLFLRERFPATERAQSGVSAGEMIRETLTRPLFILLMICMMMTASVELGPNSWMGAVFTTGIPGIIVLAWISGLMAVLRQVAGPVVHKLSPTGILFGSAIVSGIGLWWLSFAQSPTVAFASSAVFAVGVCYFWPTMLGVAAERVPKGGALALALLGGIGAFTAGFITAPQMGRIVDRLGHEHLDVRETKRVLAEIVDTYPQLASRGPAAARQDINDAVALAHHVLQTAEAEGALPPLETANALRKAIDVGGDSPASKAAEGVLRPAENYGGRMSFRYVSGLSVILAVVFGMLYLRDRMMGGYRVEHLGQSGANN